MTAPPTTSPKKQIPSNKKALAIIAAFAAGGYAAFCVGFITLSIDAAWKGVLHTGYEAELGIFIGILLACVAGALGGVVRAGRFGAYLGSLSFAALFVWMCWATIQDLSLRHFQITVGELIALVEVALAFALGLVVAKRMVSSPRFQFSMKTLLLLMVMCAFAFGLASVRGQLRKQWWEQKVEATRREQRQVLAKVQHFQCFPEWGEREFEGHVVGLRLVAIPPVQDDELSNDLAHLKDLDRLKRLIIEGTAVTETARMQDVLGSFPSLESWSFDQPKSVTRD